MTMIANIPNNSTLQAPQPAPRFPVMGPVNYHTVLQGLHQTRMPNWYLEIGTATGSSLALAQAKSIAIDPRFSISSNVLGKKPQIHLLQMTSDQFFAEEIAAQLNVKIDLAFLDGMHLFEFLLRDFIGTEKISNRDGMIMLHDCCPTSFVMAQRDRASEGRKAWTGDVWKLVPILRKYRPDLTLQTLDCLPTGLVLITGLDPGNRVLENTYQQILAEFSTMKLDHASLPMLLESLKMESSAEFSKYETFIRTKSLPKKLLRKFYKFWWQ